MKKQSKSENALMAPLCLIIDHDRARYGEFPKDELVKIGLDVTVERNQAFKDKVSIAIPDGENALELAYAIGLAVQTHFISAKLSS